MERYQQSDPFKFLIYAEQAGAELGPVQQFGVIPAPGPPGRFFRQAEGSCSSGPVPGEELAIAVRRRAGLRRTGPAFRRASISRWASLISRTASASLPAARRTLDFVGRLLISNRGWIKPAADHRKKSLNPFPNSRIVPASGNWAAKAAVNSSREASDTRG